MYNIICECDGMQPTTVNKKKIECIVVIRYIDTIQNHIAMYLILYEEEIISNQLNSITSSIDCKLIALLII